MCRQFSLVYLLLQPAGTVTTNSGMHSYVMFCLFWEKCIVGTSWKFISVGPGKSWKMIFLKEWSPCNWRDVVENDALCGLDSLAVWLSGKALVLVN